MLVSLAGRQATGTTSWCQPQGGRAESHYSGPRKTKSPAQLGTKPHPCQAYGRARSVCRQVHPRTLPRAQLPVYLHPTPTLSAALVQEEDMQERDNTLRASCRRQRSGSGALQATVEALSPAALWRQPHGSTAEGERLCTRQRAPRSPGSRGPTELACSRRETKFSLDSYTRVWNRHTGVTCKSSNALRSPGAMGGRGQRGGSRAGTTCFIRSFLCPAVYDGGSHSSSKSIFINSSMVS